MAAITSVRDLLLPALWSFNHRLGPRVRYADLRSDYLTDTMELVVVHELFDHSEIEDGSYKRKFRERVEAALLVERAQDGERLKVERAQLQYRGKQAMDRKPAKVRRRRI